MAYLYEEAGQEDLDLRKAFVCCAWVFGGFNLLPLIDAIILKLTRRLVLHCDRTLRQLQSGANDIRSVDFEELVTHAHTCS